MRLLSLTFVDFIIKHIKTSNVVIHNTKREKEPFLLISFNIFERQH